MNRDKSILGVHIDDDFLNIVHLGRTENGLQICGWAWEPLEAGIVKDGLVVQDGTIARKIQAFLRTKKLKAQKAVMSSCCSTVRLKPCEISARTDSQLQEQV